MGTFLIGGCSSDSSTKKILQAQSLRVTTQDICFIPDKPLGSEILGYRKGCPREVVIPDFLTEYIVEDEQGNSKIMTKKVRTLELEASFNEDGSFSIGTKQGSEELDFENIEPEKFPVTSIKDSAFIFEDLKVVSLGNNVEVVGESAFYGNYITSLDLGHSVKIIKKYAFGKNLLVEVTLPKSLISVESQAFWDNPFLTTVIILNSETEVAADAFDEGVRVTQGGHTIIWPASETP